jgi:hypothetical protein
MSAATTLIRAPELRSRFQNGMSGFFSNSGTHFRVEPLQIKANVTTKHHRLPQTENAPDQRMSATVHRETS